MGIRRLLLPLDGSGLAEAALGLAAFLARRLGAELVLLHVVEQRPPERVHGEPHLREATEAEAYLEGIASRLKAPDLSVRIHVHIGPEANVAAAIAAHRLEQAGDLIVMSTHGRGGLRGWVLGSIAHQIVQRGCPVLLVKPETPGGPPEAIRRIVVALDGTSASEAVLPLAAEIAAGCGLPMDLITVVPSVGALGPEQRPVATFLPTATAAMLELEAEAAASYLQGIAERLKAEFKLEAGYEVARGDPVAELTKRTGRDVLLAMTTRGRYGLAGLWEGSISARVLSASYGPVLMVPAP
ncbi:universal stress protein [Thermoflexus sp.]|uniref:universal stress protein n=1 Tax=Thermoflexus sp. TaxID=1969742 RepID=UPI0035E45945